jgi:hypothetical protein
MNLTKDILNGKRLDALCTPAEVEEVNVVIHGPVLLKRTFNMTIGGVTLKFWRVMSDWHRNYQSDLSIEGLKDWGIIPEKRS